MLLLFISLAHAIDRDADGAEATVDCNDRDAAIHPGAAERCNGVDDDCDRLVDEGAPGTAWYADRDRDGYGRDTRPRVACQRPFGYVSVGGDCDDTDSSISPAAIEWCDGVDEDCDGVVDDGWTYEDYFPDNDFDGYGDGSATPTYTCSMPAGWSTDSTDCDDSTAEVNPLHTEWCDDGLDNDCNGLVDDCASDVTDQTYADASATFVSNSFADGGVSSVSFGDLDGDGHDDVVVGDSLATVGAGTYGTVGVFLGRPSGTNELGDADILFSNPDYSSAMGASVSAPGDVTGDGATDLFIGGSWDSTSASEAGAVWLFEGPFTAGHDLTPADAVARFYGESASDRLSSAVLLGDIDGDGNDDLALGAPTSSAGGRGGTAYLYYGSVTGAHTVSSADARIRGATVGDEVGTTIVGLGDTDGDGRDDFAVGAPGAEGGGSYRGSVYIYDHAPRGGMRVSTADATWTGAVDQAQAGSSLLAPGDINGDGYTDMIVGSVNVTDYNSTVSVLYGPVTGGGSLAGADATLATNDGYDAFGWNLADGGDTNGDGAWDLWVSVEARDGYTGAAWLLPGPFAGSMDAESIAVWRVAGDAANDQLGNVIATGDVDGDGVLDLAALKLGYYGTDRGLGIFESSSR